jgi:hypothetical protein
MSEEYRPSPPFIVIGVVTANTASATMQEILVALSTLGVRPAASEEEHQSVALISPDAGPLILARGFDEANGTSAGTELWVSGDLLGAPSWIELEPDEMAERERIREFVRESFLSICDSLRPLYAGVGPEWAVVPPRELAGESVWLPGDLFWSRELNEVDWSLADDLREIYGSVGRAFSHGTLIEAGRILNAHFPSPAQPIIAGQAAAKRLACSLAKLMRAHL